MAKIKLRRDLAATWTSTNPTLAAGEPGYETDTKKIKYGDGTTAWTSLGYAIPTFTIGTEGAASGDGGLAYNQTTGVLTYTPPAYIGLTGISVWTEAVASAGAGVAGLVAARCVFKFGVNSSRIKASLGCTAVLPLSSCKALL